VIGRAHCSIQLARIPVALPRKGTVGGVALGSNLEAKANMEAQIGIQIPKLNPLLLSGVSTNNQ